MKITTITLSLLVGIGTGCTSVPLAPVLSLSDLPNCFDTNYYPDRGLFTIRNDVGNAVNQQCLLTVGPRGDVASASRLTAGRYTIYLSNGGGGGAGGTLLATGGGGGGGGGGAGAEEIQATVNLTEGVYKLTIGAGGPGGRVCLPGAGFGGGPGWAGSPSNMIRVATGEVVIGTPLAHTYVRPTRAQSERLSGERDAHGGSGPGQTSGGQGAGTETKGGVKQQVLAEPGAGKLASGITGGAAGSDPVDQTRSGAGGGGGATSMGPGGAGGGEVTPQKAIAPENIAPVRGSLGGGGGGGEGSSFLCDPGAAGGHGYIALRRN